MRGPWRTRGRVVEALRRRLLDGWPRLTMLGFVTVTGLAGLLASVAMLRAGLHAMGLRYALAALVAYGVLLVQLRIWLALMRRANRLGDDRRDHSDVLDELDPLDLVESIPAPRPTWVGGSGSFQGGGATGSWAGARLPVTQASAPEVSDGTGLGVELDLDLDGVAVALLAMLAALAAAGLVVAGWLVWSAPTLLAEVLLDGALSAALYRRLRLQAAPPGAWAGALRATWVPALVVLGAFLVAGLIAQAAAPGAVSIGGVVEAMLARR